MFRCLRISGTTLPSNAFTLSENKTETQTDTVKKYTELNRNPCCLTILYSPFLSVWENVSVSASVNTDCRFASLADSDSHSDSRRVTVRDDNHRGYLILTQSNKFIAYIIAYSHDIFTILQISLNNSFSKHRKNRELCLHFKASYYFKKKKKKNNPKTAGVNIMFDSQDFA